MVSNVNFFVLFLIFFLFCFNIQAQNDEIFLCPEIYPVYHGGEEELQKFIANHLIYPQEAKEKGIEEVIPVRCIIEKDGALSNIELANNLKEYDFGFVEEAIRVVNNMPPWEPGKINGKNVRTKLLIPVRFSLDSAVSTNLSNLCLSTPKNFEKKMLFSTSAIFRKDGIFYDCNIFLNQNNQYQIVFSETAFDDMIENLVISEGSYIKENQYLKLIDKHSHLVLEYQIVNDTILHQPVFPNRFIIKLIPIRTFSFLKNQIFTGDSTMHASISKYGSNCDLFQTKREFEQSNKERRLSIGIYKTVDHLGGTCSDIVLNLGKNKNYQLYCYSQFILSSGKWSKKRRTLILQDSALKHNFQGLIGDNRIKLLMLDIGNILKYSNEIKQ